MNMVGKNVFVVRVMVLAIMMMLVIRGVVLVKETKMRADEVVKKCEQIEEWDELREKLRVFGNGSNRKLSFKECSSDIFRKNLDISYKEIDILADLLLTHISEERDNLPDIPILAKEDG